MHPIRPDRPHDTGRRKTYAATPRTPPYPTVTPYPTDMPQLDSRFTSKIEVDPITGCWNWTAHTNKKGYGRYGNNGGRKATPAVVYAHIHAFKKIIGRYPNRLELDHLCRNVACCNPWHVEPVTPRTNNARGLQSNNDGLCRRGLHPWVPDNIIEGNRCRECRNAWYRRRYERNKGNVGTK